VALATTFMINMPHIDSLFNVKFLKLLNYPIMAIAITGMLLFILDFYKRKNDQFLDSKLKKNNTLLTITIILWSIWLIYSMTNTACDIVLFYTRAYYHRLVINYLYFVYDLISVVISTWLLCISKQMKHIKDYEKNYFEIQNAVIPVSLWLGLSFFRVSFFVQHIDKHDFYLIYCFEFVRQFFQVLALLSVIVVLTKYRGTDLDNRNFKYNITNFEI